MDNKERGRLLDYCMEVIETIELSKRIEEGMAAMYRQGFEDGRSTGDEAGYERGWKDGLEVSTREEFEHGYEAGLHAHDVTRQ